MVALSTFENLKEERRQQIISVSLEEFALSDYQTASLSNIIKKLGLAKGSFYRYFENKQSLYFYLLDYCIAKRLENDKTLVQEEPEDFFELVLQHFRAKVHFDRSYPLASAFLYNVLVEKNSDEIGNIRYTSRDKALQILEKMVHEYVQKQQLRNDLDEKVIAWYVVQTQLSILDYIEHHFQQDIKANIKARKQLYDIPEEEIMAVARQFVEIQKNGIQPHAGH